MEKGIKQVDCLSLLLFIKYTEKIFKISKHNAELLELKLETGNQNVFVQKHTLYADYIVRIANSTEKLQKIIVE